MTEWQVFRNDLRFMVAVWSVQHAGILRTVQPRDGAEKLYAGSITKRRDKLRRAARNMTLIGIRVPLIAERPEPARDDLLANSPQQERQ
jgi:hypothetical protein